MRTHFVDKLLARLDGEVASIWITIAVCVDKAPAVQPMREMLVALHRSTPRLHAIWSEPQGCWRPGRHTDATLAASLEVSEEPMSRADHMSRLIARRIDLTRGEPEDLGFIVGMHALVDGRTLVTFQLHHALGDARSLGLLLRRMFGSDPPNVHGDTSPQRPRMQPASVLLGAARHARASLSVARARTRMLSARGVALRRDADEVGAPQVRCAAFELDGGPREHAGWFYAALAHTAAQWTDAASGLVRLRVPIDLSERFAFGGPPSNTCITVPLELDVARLRGAESGADTHAYVRAELRRLVARGAVWPALLETLALSRVATQGRLRAGARPGLLAARRTNTMVATYVGALDRYFVDAPFGVTSAVGHTPTWGASAFTLGGRLVVNVSAFEGLWSPETLARFSNDMSRWLVVQGARPVEQGP